MVALHLLQSQSQNNLARELAILFDNLFLSRLLSILESSAEQLLSKPNIRCWKLSRLLKYLKKHGGLGKPWNLFPEPVLHIFQCWLPHVCSSLLPHWLKHYTDNLTLLVDWIRVSKKIHSNRCLDLTSAQRGYCCDPGRVFIFLVRTYKIKW